MLSGKDYLKEIQKFVTSQYWNSGVRITTGVLIPMLVIAFNNWLPVGIPFLLGSLFVSLTDTPGPIHHRRNGMLVATTLNTAVVALTILSHDYTVLLLGEVVLFSFIFTLIGIYGARAGSVGTLALVIMLLNMSPQTHQTSLVSGVLLTATGGLWYTSFSMLLYRLQPYRLVEQGLGEYLLSIADYLRARAGFYKTSVDLEESFNRVMHEQVNVLNIQNHIRELLFKTRQFVGDPSPKSRSMMMIYVEATDMFEETMYAYQDYKLLRQHLDDTDILHAFYKVILETVAEIEYLGLMVQAGNEVKKLSVSKVDLDLLRQKINEKKKKLIGEEQHNALSAIEQTANNIETILNRLVKIALYTRTQTQVDAKEVPEISAGSSINFNLSLLKENLSFKSNQFKFALRITIAMLVGYLVSSLLSLSHTYWVLLTIITILKPGYNLSRKRNIKRVVGTLAGVLIAAGLLLITSNNTVLFILMVLSMLLAYSFLRIYYLAFVTCLTVYVIITFHFLNPQVFRELIGVRLVDTVIGSIIAGLASRFVFPVWQRKNIKTLMQDVLESNIAYLNETWMFLGEKKANTITYDEARREAIVTLTNLSDSFQQMLTEPFNAKETSLVHQFVIATHTLTSSISALTEKDINVLQRDDFKNEIITVTKEAIDNLNAIPSSATRSPAKTYPPVSTASVIYSIALDIRGITKKIRTPL
ncbi:FUSC family protein [Chryseosolibacter indicus]|uniref:FUSC family protein n=1 Tax=Chryseosolibacter indicus TaxID=2782351 RepID=A0ABS5VPH2_9BACT|nr:FUSC family membrane protein [Chryseosolibacter indicus]MBT1703333.1 FUSC family protein [Chryseosolibacter indicus]